MNSEQAKAKQANQAHFDSCPTCSSDERGYCNEGVRLAQAAAFEFEDATAQPMLVSRSCEESFRWHVMLCDACQTTGVSSCKKGAFLAHAAQEELMWFPEPSERNED